MGPELDLGLVTTLAHELRRPGSEVTVRDLGARAVDLVASVGGPGAETPAFALVRAFGIARFEELTSEQQALVRATDDAASDAWCLVLLASRGVREREGAALGMTEGVLPMTPTALAKAPVLAELVARLGLDARDVPSPVASFHAGEGSELAATLDPAFVSRAGVRDVFATAARLPTGHGLVVLAFARLPLAASSPQHLPLFALSLLLGLLSADEAQSRLPAEERPRLRAEALEALALASEGLREKEAVAARARLKAAVDATRTEAAARQAELVATNAKLRRSQRAVLNVVDDLREARTELEARVEERTRFVVDILESMQDSFFSLDRELRFVLMNRHHEAMTGGARASLAGRSLFDVFPQVEGTPFCAALRRVQSTGEPTQLVGRLPPLDLWLAVSVSRAPDGGVAVFYRDVTVQRALEAERERLLERERVLRQEAEAARAHAEGASRMKDQFLSTVSHELRTPLNAILGWSTMLRGGALDAEKRVTALDTIERNARAQVRLIEDLLDLGRILQGKFQLAVGPVEVVRVVESAIDSLRPAAEAKGVRLQRALDSHATIIGDAERLQQIVWNLLSNAIKFTPRGGRVHVTVQRAPSFVEIAVADSGMGIDPDLLPHVFEPFRQGDAAISKRTGGLGLGLSIVRSLVELHGGTVKASSDGVERGSTFTVRIPVAPVRAAASEPARANHDGATTPTFERPTDLVGARILIVDDERDTRELLGFVLEECGAHVTTAESAKQAVDALASAPFDVMVSDVGMPDEDGLSMIARIRKLPADKGGRVPAAALTAYARSEDRAQAIRAGFDTHLAKPIDLSELALVVAALIRNQRAWRDELGD